MTTRLKGICHLIIYSGDSNSERSLYEVTTSLKKKIKLIYIFKRLKQ